MSPNNLNQNQHGGPASLPPVATVAGAGQPTQSVPVPTAATQAAGVVDITGRVVAEAERLAGQYANDPYRLCEAFGQLKAAYLVQKYNLELDGQPMER